PTSAGGGSFMLSLQADWRTPRPESHQRSWWIVHTQPTSRLANAPSRIPPPQLVDRSYSAYKPTGVRPVPNPTNAVGGSFILSLQADWRTPRPESHHRSWWIVHTQPTSRLAYAPSRIPPTQLVDRSYSAYISAAACPSRIPPTQLVDRSYPAYKGTGARPVRNPTNAVGGSFIPELRCRSHLQL